MLMRPPGLYITGKKIEIEPHTVLSKQSFTRICWTDTLVASTTTTLPGVTITSRDPETTTSTLTFWDLHKRDGAIPTPTPKAYPRIYRHEDDEETTIYEVNECTRTMTALVTSTIKSVDPTITTTTTAYASTYYTWTQITSR
jgi:hypothetical protein